MIIENGIWGQSYKSQNIFLKSRKIVRMSHIFKSKLFHSITVDGKKVKMFSTEEGMLLLVLVLYALLTLGSILKRCCVD